MGLEFRLVFLDVVPKAHTANFLFAFDQHLEIDRKFAVELPERFEGLQMNVYLPLIVGRAPAENVSVAHLGLERRRSPELKRFGGLYVVMPIEKDGRFSRSVERFRINQGMKVGRHDFDRTEAGGTKMIGHPPGGPFDVGLVLAFGANRRDPKKFAKFRKVLFAATFDKFCNVHRKPSDTMIHCSMKRLKFPRKKRRRNDPARRKSAFGAACVSF